MNVNYIFAKIIGKIQRPSLQNCSIDKTSKVYEKSKLKNVEMGKHSYIGKNCIVSDAKIGQFCSIAGYSQIGGGMHPIDMVSTSPCFLSGRSSSGKNFAQIHFETSDTVEIGNDVWIGAGCYIKAGIKIGNGAVVGAHAVVTKDVAPYSIVAGVPAREIRKRFDEKTIRQLSDIEWWNWSDDKLKEYGKDFDNPEKLIAYIKLQKKRKLL